MTPEGRVWAYFAGEAVDAGETDLHRIGDYADAMSKTTLAAGLRLQYTLGDMFAPVTAGIRRLRDRLARKDRS